MIDKPSTARSEPASRLCKSPRVDGSIPSLATISNSMNCNGFRVSPADHTWSSMADPRTNGKWVGGGHSLRHPEA